MIELWDSTGQKQTNQVYLTSARRYLYDVHNSGEQENSTTLEEWDQEWCCSDKSAHSPTQRNGDDCGIFTLVSMALLSQGHLLRNDSYSQDVLLLRQTRRRIAYLIYSSGIEDPSTPWIATPTPTVTTLSGEQTNRRRKAAGKTSGPNKKHKRNHGRLVLGGVKVRRRLTADKFTPTAPPASAPQQKALGEIGSRRNSHTSANNTMTNTPKKAKETKRHNRDDPMITAKYPQTSVAAAVSAGSRLRV